MLHNRHSSLGYHTVNFFRRFDYDDIEAIFKDIKQFSKESGKIMLYPTDLRNSCYRIDYTDKYSSIDYWQIRSCYSSQDFKEHTVEAKVNPKILAGESDYIRAAGERHFPLLAAGFNEEARKLSSLLYGFNEYRPNRIDYCVNFDLQELGYPCEPLQMMELIKRSNIPAHYVERKEYHPTAKRMKALPNSFYLKSNSVRINCYGKFDQLSNNYQDNPSLEDSLSVVRFEVQCRYIKLYNMMARARLKGVPDEDLLRHLLSDEVARETVIGYFNRIIMRGDYYTLKEATERVKVRRFGVGKEERMIDALNLISQQRGIYKAKAIFPLASIALARFNRAMNELVDEMNINPVTIPKSFGIKYLPGLMDAYLRLEFTGVRQMSS